jgi:glycosyltransferase involved in cell wall biosynthesis
LWDQRTAHQVDHFLTNSAFIARRIDKIYRRPAAVVHPPVEVERFALRPAKEDYYLAVSRFVPYKHTETIIAAFRDLPAHRLVVIGDGPGLKRARARVPGNVTLLGFQPFDALRRHMGRAKALIFAAEEDFGITPVEAQACGTPVIAFGGGGALETVRALGQPRPTGLFFPAQTVAAIAAAVERFEREGGKIAPADCRTHAFGFTPERFRAAYLHEVSEAWSRHGGHVVRPFDAARAAVRAT